MKKNKRRRADVILLKDLAPQKVVKGGASKRIFGQPIEPKEGPPSMSDRRPAKPEATRTRRKDLDETG